MEEKIDELIRLTRKLVDVLEHTNPEKKLLHGIKDLADYISCSLSTAKRIKASGILDPATSQVNRTIVFDGEKVLELLSTSKSKWTHLGESGLKSKKK